MQLLTVTKARISLTEPCMHRAEPRVAARKLARATNTCASQAYKCMLTQHYAVLPETWALVGLHLGCGFGPCVVTKACAKRPGAAARVQRRRRER